MEFQLVRGKTGARSELLVKGFREDLPNIPRRELLKGGVAALVLAMLARDSRPSQEGEFVTRQPSELFNMRLSGLERSYATLGGDEVLFIDEHGLSIGEPVKLKPIDGISPGVMRGNVLLTAPIRQPWLDAARRRLCAQTPGIACDVRSETPRQLNVIPSIREANIDSPEEHINAQNYMDIVRHYGSKPTIGGGGTNRIAYVRAHIGDTMNLPETLKKEIAFLSLGVTAQESRFNNDMVSTAGARGAFQFMPKTWESLGFKEEDCPYLVPQVKAAGKHFSNILLELNKHAEPELARIKATFFNGDEDSFERFFLAPLMVNGYNAGGPRMAAIVRWFSAQYPDRKTFESTGDKYPNGYGYDLFKRLTDEARAHADVPGVGPLLSRYKDQASQYFFRAMALARLLEKDKKEGTKGR